MKEDVKFNKDNEDVFYNFQKFEVLYCGKVTVIYKKVSFSFIDDCIEKFSLYEQQRLRIQGEQRGADVGGEDFVVFEVEAFGFFVGILLEEGDGVINIYFVLVVSVSQFGSFSFRGCFFERILEDFGFDEQQEFRFRCSSVIGVL